MQGVVILCAYPNVNGAFVIKGQCDSPIRARVADKLYFKAEKSCINRVGEDRVVTEQVVR